VGRRSVRGRGRYAVRGPGQLHNCLPRTDAALIFDYDVEWHPGHPAVDLSKYGTRYDELVAAANAVEAQGVKGNFTARGDVHAADLWDHYYGNTGASYRLNEGTFLWWAKDTYHNYPDPLPAPAQVTQTSLDAIRIANAEADQTGRDAEVVVTTDWVTVAGWQEEEVYSLGAGPCAPRLPSSPRPTLPATTRSKYDRVGICTITTTSTRSILPPT
jgi:hypothetical protein